MPPFEAFLYKRWPNPPVFRPVFSMDGLDGYLTAKFRAEFPSAPRTCAVSMLITNSFRRSPGSCISSCRRSSACNLARRVSSMIWPLSPSQIGADCLERSECAVHSRMAIPTQHPSWIANLLLALMDADFLTTKVCPFHRFQRLLEQSDRDGRSALTNGIRTDPGEIAGVHL